MRPSISQLRGWNLDGLAAAGIQSRDNVRSLDEALDKAERAIANAPNWYGQTHDAATARIEQEVDHGRELSNVLNQISDNAEDAARDLSNLRSFILGKVDEATSRGFAVSDTGQVTHPDAERGDDAEQYQSAIQSGLDEVDRLDTRYGQALRASAKDLAAMVNGQPDVTLPSGERIDPDALMDRLAAMSPDERAAMLATLNPETLHALVIADPQRFGNMDGVPFDARIASNEINIRNALTDELQKVPPDQARVDQLNAMLGTIDDPITPENDQVDRQFVGFSPEGNGRMVELIGSIQPGINGVGVVVPGTNTNLNGSSSNHKSALALADQSNSPILLYVGGDFPQGLDKAADETYARDMAPKLVEFGHEVDREVGRSAAGTPVTYIGHSYGGAIVGTAEQLGLRADRIVHASSAGTGIYTAPYENPNPDVQRFSLTAPGDPIGAIQSLPRDTGIAPMGLPENADGQVGNPLGGLPGVTDPDNIPGVVRLDTGYYGSEFNDHRPGEIIVGTDGHGQYWDDPNSTAFQNMAGVIAGGDVSLYVDRGIETNAVDINVGDAGNLDEELWDQTVAVTSQQAAQHIPFVPDEWADPWGGARVTDNANIGERYDVK